MTTTIVRSAAPLVLGLLLLSGCGGGTAPSPTPLASESPAQIVQAAQNTVNRASGYEVEVSGTSTSGSGSPTPAREDLMIHGKNAAGSGQILGQTVRVALVDGAAYIDAPAAFWTRATGGLAGSIFANRWLRVPSSALGGTNLSELTDLLGTWRQQAGTLSRGGTGIVDGQAVVLVKSHQAGTLAVADTGTPYPVRIDGTFTPPGAAGSGSFTGTVDYSSWNAVPAITAPPSAIVLPTG